MSKKKLGIYIHVPFCLKKCAYCNFYSSTKLNFIPDYIQNLCEQIELQPQLFDFSNYEVNSIYFGGGTPSLLNSRQIGKVLGKLFATFKVGVEPEISLEGNPSSMDKQFLTELRNLGVNRLSIGVQSAMNAQLQKLGRLHSFERSKQVFDFAVSAGFANLSADLIIGVPGQTSTDLFYSFEQFSQLPLTHISIYILKLERGTPFFLANFDNMPSDDEVASYYEQSVDYFTRRGFVHYEISNFAKPGFECVHNLKYWQMQPYLGLGPGAHSYIKGQRFFVEPSLRLFLDKRFTTIKEQALGIEFKLEWLMLRSRLNTPIKLKELEEHGFKADQLEPKLKQLARAKLIELEGAGFKLTTSGFLVQNSIVLLLANG